MTESANDLEALCNALEATPDAELIFVAAGEEIRPGYHVTEVKRAAVTGLDCGRQTASWSELIVQLLNGPREPNRHSGYLPARTFLKIVSAAQQSEIAVANSELFFEFAPLDGDLCKFQATDVARHGERVYVTLESARAACKPALRLLGGKSGAKGACYSHERRCNGDAGLLLINQCVLLIANMTFAICARVSA